jgi:hypothetical protein
MDSNEQRIPEPGTLWQRIAVGYCEWHNGEWPDDDDILEARAAAKHIATYVECLQRVSGECPMGCGRTLFLGEGGHVTCSLLGCPNPGGVDELLHLDHEHYAVLDEQRFTVEHPARERIDGNMHDCPLHVYLRQLDGAPMKPGRYRVVGTPSGWAFQECPRSGAGGGAS